MPQPPILAQRLLHTFCRTDLVEDIEGDLDESFADWLAEGSPRRARGRYWREVLLLLRPRLMRSWGPKSAYYLPIDMWKNYFKTAVRQISRHRLFSALNVLGLALSFSVCLLIIMALVDQYSYDLFQTERDRTYRVISDAQREGMDLKPQFATAPLRLAEELERSYPFVERAIPLQNAHYALLKGDLPLDMRGFYTDGRFLEGFSFGWQRGDRAGALDDPREIVLTQEAVARLFDGKVELGQMVQVDGVGECLLTGIMPDPPFRSQLRFDYLLSLASLPAEEISWRSIYQSYVYAQLQPGSDPSQLSEALTAIAKEQSATDEQMNFYFEPQPMTEVVPGQGLANTPTAELPATVLHLLGGLAVIILLLAIFNYTNLGLARALRRAREVSIRKVAGARRSQIIGQMLLESVIVALLALGLGVVLLEYLIPAFLSLHPNLKEVFLLERSLALYLGFVGFAVLVGLLAGWLPARYLSHFEAGEGLKKLMNVRGLSYRHLRKGLILVQFMVCFIFTLTTLTILQQKEHLLSVDLGLRTEQVINVGLQQVDFERFRQQAKQVQGVERVVGSSIIPAGQVSMGMLLQRKGQDEVQIDYNRITPGYLEALDIDLLAGQAPADFAAEGMPIPILLNERALSTFGYATPQEAVGELLWKNLQSQDSTQPAQAFRIAGVVEDFYHRSLMSPDSKIEPFALTVENRYLSYAAVQVSGANLAATIQGLQSVWQGLDHPDPLQYSFFEEDVAKSFFLFDMASKVLGFIGILAVVIACMGLLGMVVFAMEGRLKEVGIRKVLGASSGNLMWKLGREFVWLLLIAAVIALPLGLYLNQQWLQMYSLRIPLSLNVLLPTLLIVAGLSLWIVLSQTYWAARINPREVLQEE